MDDGHQMNDMPILQPFNSEQHVLIPRNYFRTPFPRPWQYQPPVALLGTWWKLSRSSLPTTVPSPPFGQAANAMGMAFQDEARQRQRHRRIRHGIACDLRQNALHLQWCKGHQRTIACLATGKFWQWKTTTFPKKKNMVQVGDLLILMFWNFHFFHRFPTCFVVVVFSFCRATRASVSGEAWWVILKSWTECFLHRLQWNH